MDREGEDARRQSRACWKLAVAAAPLEDRLAMEREGIMHSRFNTLSRQRFLKLLTRHAEDFGIQANCKDVKNVLDARCHLGNLDAGQASKPPR